MRYVFAVDLGGTKCSVATVNRNGRIVSRRTVPVNLCSPSGPVLQIVQLAKDLAAAKNRKKFLWRRPSRCRDWCVRTEQCGLQICLGGSNATG